MDFKLHKDCSECTKYNKKKGCKGYQFSKSVKVLSFYCPNFKKNKENKSK